MCCREPLGLDEEVIQKGGTIVTEFSQLSFGFVDSRDCYLLVHIDPPMETTKTVHSFRLSLCHFPKADGEAQGRDAGRSGGKV